MDNLMHSIEYWSKEFERVTEELQPLRSKLTQAPLPDLTYEERFQLREGLLQYYSFSTLLRSTLAELKKEQQIPFYKRFFHKK